MEKEVEELIEDIVNNTNKTNQWYLETCEKISKILNSDCSEELKNKICEYADSIFMVRNAILDI